MTRKLSRKEQQELLQALANIQHIATLDWCNDNWARGWMARTAEYTMGRFGLSYDDIKDGATYGED